jgi:hypothetical protein
VLRVVQHELVPLVELELQRVRAEARQLLAHVLLVVLLVSGGGGGLGGGEPPSASRRT